MFESLFAVLLSTYLTGEWLDHMMALYLAFWETAELFQSDCAIFTSPPAICDGFYFSVSSPAPVIIIPLFWFAFPSWQMMLSIFSPACSLYIFFREMPYANQPCIPGVSPTWLWCIILFTCCWILYTNILMVTFVHRVLFNLWNTMWD